MSPRPLFDAVKPVDRDWMVNATCRGLDVDLFYQPHGGWPQERVHALTSLCGSCPVVAECRAYAARTGDDVWGWWGGPPNDGKPSPVKELDWAACGTEKQLKRHVRRGESCGVCRVGAQREKTDRKRRSA